MKNKHVLWKTGDIGVPSQILDRNGDVVLDLCKICNRAESQLQDRDGLLDSSSECWTEFQELMARQLYERIIGNQTMYEQQKVAYLRAAITYSQVIEELGYDVVERTRN